MAAQTQRSAWIERFGPTLLVVLGVLLMALGTVIGLAGRDASAFILAGAGLTALGAMSTAVESFKGPGFEVRLREQQVQEVANAIETARDTLAEGGAADTQVDAVAEALSQAVAALRAGQRASAGASAVKRSDPRTLHRDAVAWIMELERVAGREPRIAATKDVVDLVSSDRRIEIKVVGPATRWIALSEQQVRTAREDGDFWLYLAEPLEDAREPFLVRVLGGPGLRAFLEDARPTCTYRLRLPDGMSLGDDLA